MDEQEVAPDGQPQLASSGNRLVIGGGALFMAGTYFGGMSILLTPLTYVLMGESIHSVTST